MKSVCALFIIFFSSLNVQSQTVAISGKITDQDGKPVPFVSIYLKNTTSGTSANIDGDYQLKIPAGNQTLVFKAIGYRPENKEIDAKADMQFNVTLTQAVYELQDVVIRSAGEDPAYTIIRNAIKKRKSYLGEVNSYTTNVYIKGLQKLLKAPKKFLGNDIDKAGKQIGLDSNRSGIIYLSESESKLSFIQPDHFREEMISSKVSGSNRAFSFNRASEIKVNLYENLQDWGSLSNRPFISPIADNALSYYTYKLVGTTVENGQFVNKIEVIPKRRIDPVFRGYLYILEDSWRLHSIDLYMTKEANLNFIDTLKINQQFFPVNDQVWMPSSVKFDFKGDILGFRFTGYYLAVYRNYDLSPQLNPKDFSEFLRITKEVNTKDSSYWNSARPIPLTDEENNDYKKKKSLAAKRESKFYLDSLDQVKNEFNLLKFTIGSGYTFHNRYKKESYRFSSLKNSVFYNTVEGFGVNYTVGYTKHPDTLNIKSFSVNGKIRYGFSSNDLYGSVFGNLPVKKSRLDFNIGSDVVDLNNLGTVRPLGNTINSLFYETNLLKLYEKRFITLSLSQRITTGLETSFSAEWANRRSLQNTSNYTFRNLKDKKFTSNNPITPDFDTPLFPENQSFKISLRATYEFSKKYATYPNGKVYLPSKYPKLGVSYTKGLKNWLGSDVDYDLLSVDISKSNIPLGLYGKTTFWLGTGKFLNNRSLFFPDYKHFIGTQTLGYKPQINTFLFLGLYNFSTPKEYFEGHLEHNFSGLILNKIPVIRKLKLQEIIGFNFLATPASKNYIEYYFGVQYLGFGINYGFSYSNGERIDKGFKIAYQF